MLLQPEDEILSKLKAHDRLANENSELLTKVRLLQHDKEKLGAEIDKVSFIIMYYSILPATIFVFVTVTIFRDLLGIV